MSTFSVRSTPYRAWTRVLEISNQRWIIRRACASMKPIFSVIFRDKANPPYLPRLPSLKSCISDATTTCARKSSAAKLSARVSPAPTASRRCQMPTRSLATTRTAPRSSAARRSARVLHAPTVSSPCLTPTRLLATTRSARRTSAARPVSVPSVHGRAPSYWVRGRRGGAKYFPDLRGYDPNLSPNEGLFTPSCPLP